MGTQFHIYFSTFIIFVFGLIFAPQNLRADDLPDLIISPEARIPKIGSCKKDEPLWSGVIAIKNIGNAEAKFQGGGGLTSGGILEASQAKNSILTVYVPQNIDIKVTKALNRALQPLDQRGFAISIGVGRFKKCRLFSDPPHIRDKARRNLSTYGYGSSSRPARRTNNVSALQRALIAKGYSLPNFGVDGDYGSETEAAVREFYADNGGAIPGDVGARPPSHKTVDDLLDRLDGTVADTRECSSGARRKKETITIYAIVDPGDEITELNEANNSATFTVEIDCSHVEK